MKASAALVAVLLLVACAEAYPRFPASAVKAAPALEGADEKSEPFETKWFDQVIDHFNFKDSATAPTWKQRYLMTTKYYKEGGPVFFYCGNEGGIEMFWKNTGFMFEKAAEMGAVVIFAEHRYYGESLPFGDKSFTNDNLGYLTIPQALADYAIMIPALKKELKADNAAVIAFGGSYGGMLAAWIRQLYPAVVDGALAASAPVLNCVTGDNVFNKILTQTFARSGDGCHDTIREGFKAIVELIKTAEGRAELTETFHLCNPIREGEEAALAAYINNAFSYMAMVDYPYPSSFLMPLPAWPVKAACSKLAEASGALKGTYEAMNVYYNSTNTFKCYDITKDDSSPSLGLDAWAYQTCTEMAEAEAANGVDDMFWPPRPYNFTQVVDECKTKFNVVPRTEWIKTMFGGADLRAASNIVFSNGDLDPWNGGGVLEDVNESVVAVNIKNAAHHLDLRYSDPLDTPEVLAAREVEVKHIKRWIAEKAAAVHARHAPNHNNLRTVV